MRARAASRQGADLAAPAGRRGAASAAGRAGARRWLGALLLMGLLLALLAAAPARAAISLVGTSTTAADNAAVITLAAPAGVAVGDVMVAFVAQRDGGALGFNATPAGWSSLLLRNNGTALGVAVFVKLAGAADAGANFTWQIDRSDRVAAGMLAFRGVDSVVPVDASASQANGASTTYTAPTVTTSATGAMLVALYAAVNGNDSVATATGMNFGFGIGTLAGPNGVMIGASYAVQAGAGASGNKLSTGNSSLASVGALVALREAAPATLRAEYRFDECTLTTGAANTVLDSSGAGRHGTPFGVTQPSPAGRINRALGLAAAGTGDYARLDHTALNGVVDFSVALWFRTGVTKPQQEILQALGTSGVTWDDIEIYLVNASQVVVNVRDSSEPAYVVTSPATLTDNAWHHLAFVRRGGTGCLFIDGALVQCRAVYASTALTIQPNTFLVGQEQDAYGASFNSGQAWQGLIDEIKLYAGALTAADVASIHANESAGLNADGTPRAPDACAGPHHYELALPSTALACLASPVTVTACADASSPCTNRATTIAGQTATLATSAGSLASTTLTFDASGIASTTLQHPAAADGAAVTVTLSAESAVAANPRQCCPDGVACVVANSCTTTFRTAGLVIAAAPDGAVATIPTQTAAAGSGPLVLRAVRSGTTTRACEAALVGAQNVEWSYTCNDPTTCAAGNRLTLTGNAAVAIAGNPNPGGAAATAVPMTFDANGNAPFSFGHADVGRITLVARKPAGGTLLTALTGASNPFVVRPAGFTLSDIRCTNYAAGSCAVGAIASPGNNPAAATAAGSAFIPAGQPFTATVTAVDALGNATPNYGRETSPEGVVLTPNLVAPVGGSNGTLANATVGGASFAAGAATVTTLAYSEVGIVTLTPAVADADYLGAGNVTGAASGNVGRFIPARFARAGGTVTHRAALACAPASTFSYLGENFTLGFALTAQNSAGATTANYVGAFAKLDPTAAGAYNLAGRDGATVFSSASGRLSLGSAAGAWAAGVANVTLTAAALRAVTPDGPFNAAFGIAPVDSDGVALAAFDLSVTAPFATDDRASVGTVALRFGRLQLASAIGAADRPLALPASAQFWNGSAFDVNTLDSCTAVAASAVSFGNLRRTLTVADTAVASPIALAAGRGTLRLAAPGGGRSGSVDVALSLGSAALDASCLQPWAPGAGDAATAGANLPFLRGAWCSAAFDKDPSARATFGQQRGNDFLVYRRENY